MTTALNNALANTDGPFSYTGQSGGCTINTYICSGKDVGSKDGYDACKERERQERCTAAEGRWKNSGVNGKFEVSGCEVKWQCGSMILTSQADYDASVCGKKWTCEMVQDPCRNVSTKTQSCQTLPFIGKVCTPVTTTTCVYPPKREVCEWK